MMMPFAEAPLILRVIFLVTLNVECCCFFSILLSTLRYKRISSVIVSGFFLLTSYLFLQLLSARSIGAPGVMEFIPAISVHGAMIIIALFLVEIIFSLRLLNWYERNKVTVSSIKQGTDSLTTGLCYFFQDGMMKLSNSLMKELCYRLTGKRSTSGYEFWDAIEKASGFADPPIVAFNGLGVFLFRRSVVQVEDEQLYEIVADNVTDMYTISREIQQKNKTLEQMNARLRELSDSVTNITIEKEILTAKINIHDELGHAILAAHRYLVAGGDRQELLTLWKSTVLSLSAAAQQLEEVDEYEQMNAAAEDVGITLEIHGDLPTSPAAKKLTATAIHECMTNTIIHAGGDTVFIDVDEDDLEYVIRFTNNGLPPEGTVQEGGGLTSLRHLAEEIGAEMTLEFDPLFALVLSIPKVV